MRAFWVLFGLTLFGCASANRVEQWPYRGSLITVYNDTHGPVSVVAHSDVRGGHLISRRLWPGSRTTFRWPWIDQYGMLLATPHNTMMFSPWDSSWWCWRVSEPTVTKGKCP